MGGQAELTGPDFEKDGAAYADIADGGMVVGHAQGESVLVARRGDALHAIGASCTHYGGPLGEGALVGDEVRCPWHHARFSLTTGEATSAPALNPVACWKVERRGERVFVTGKDEKRRLPVAPAGAPARIVIVGAGAAGNCAAEALRNAGYAGSVAMVGADADVPYDRPNLSKDYLAGTAPEEWIPLRSREFYDEKKIALHLGVRATALDPKAKTVTLSDGATLPFDALLLATGADPVKLPIPGADLGHVFTLRSLADSRALIAAATKAKRAVVVGASFIGLEVAAALRTRGLEVDVVGPEATPLERVLGPAVGGFLRALHESHGVRFHLGEKPARFTASHVELASGASLPCDLVVVGVGVRPNVALAQAAGLAVDNGIVVDERLQTSVPGIFAAGDAARYPEARSGQRVRIEHWVVAERQGQAVARAMLGEAQAFRSVPFFWSAHYDVTLAYVGHSEKWDAIAIDGSLEARDATIVYREKGVVRAVATIGRDAVSLAAEVALEQNDEVRLAALAR